MIEAGVGTLNEFTVFGELFHEAMTVGGQKWVVLPSKSLWPNHGKVRLQVTLS